MPTILLNKIQVGAKTLKNITVGNKEVRCVYKGSTLVYDTLSHYNESATYGTPSLTITYPVLARTGGGCLQQ